MTEAAARNRVGRSAVSQAIRALELSLGVKLLQHAKNAFEPTTEGRLLAAQAEEVLEAMTRLRAQVQGAQETASGALRIGVSHSVAISVLPAKLKRLLKSHPSAELSLQLANPARIRELLLERSIDVGIGLDSSEAENGAIERLPFLSGSFVLARGPKSRDSRWFLIGDQGPEVAAFRREIAHRPRLADVAILPVQSWEVIAALAAGGAGTGLLPDFVVRRDPSLRTVRAPFALGTYRLSLLTRRGAYLSRSAREFLRLARAR